MGKYRKFMQVRIITMFNLIFQLVCYMFSLVFLAAESEMKLWTGQFLMLE
jgi:hypothetical protein